MELQRTLSTGSPEEIEKLVRYDYLFKVVLLGDAQVGKTSLLKRFTEDTFSSEYLNTIGVDFKTKLISHKEKTIKLQIWDSAGRAKFAAISELFYVGTMAAIYCFDLTNKESFQHVENWMQKLTKSQHNTNKDDVIGVVVGCKADLSNDRKVSKEKGQELAIRHHARYVEVSALTAKGIEELFQALTKSMVSRHQGWQRESLIQEPASNRIRKISQAVGLQSDSKVFTTLQRSKTLTASWRHRQKRKTSASTKREEKSVVKSNSFGDAEVEITVMTPLSEEPEHQAGNSELDQKKSKKKSNADATCKCCVIS
eukprot:13179.XXX_370663_368964_1 [CDS] Oithona nana genome sequencing.